MAFHEVRFPDNISRGARGGPERRTQIVELASGDEERNASWANSRRRYDVAYGIRRADDLAAVVAFFEARNGRLHGFRYKDWADYKSCAPSQPVAPPISHRHRQWRAHHIRAAEALQLRRPKLDPRYCQARGRQRAHRAERDRADGGWSVDATTGVVSFDTAPGAASPITAGFAFDVPVRFDTDTLDVTLDIERLGSITSIPLLEIRR